MSQHRTRRTLRVLLVLLTVVVTTLAAVGVAGIWSPKASANTITIKAQGANTKFALQPGDTLYAGYSFHFSGNNCGVSGNYPCPPPTPRRTAFRNPTASIDIKCQNGAVPNPSTVKIAFPDATYDGTVGSNGWYPSGQQSSDLVYQGSTTMPDACGGGTMVQGSNMGPFVADVQLEGNTLPKVDARWHYGPASVLSSNGGTGTSWSATASVVPDPFTPEPPADLANLRVTKGAPETVASNGDIKYTISVVNTGTTTAHDVTVTDVLSDDLDLAGIALPTGCGLQGRTLTCDLDPLGPGENHALSFVVHPRPGLDPGTNIENCAEATTTTPESDDTNNKSCTTTTVKDDVTDIAIDKTGPATVQPGGTVEYRLKATNLGRNPAHNVVVADELPAGLTGFTPPDGCRLNDRNLTCAIDNLEAGGSRTYTVTGTLATGTEPGTVLDNCATAETDTPQTDYANDESCVRTVVGELPTNISIEKTGTAAAEPGGQVGYTLTVTNHGPNPARNVTVSDPIPAQLTNVTADGCTRSDTILTCDVGTLDAGGTREFTVTGRVAGDARPGTAIGNCATVKTSTPQEEEGDDESCLQTTVTEPPADVAVEKIGTASAEPGGDVEYTIRATNRSANPAQNVIVRDRLPAELVGVTPPDGCTLNGRNLACSVGTLEAGGTREFKVTGTVAGDARPGTTIGNCAIVKTTTPDTDKTNNLSCTETTVGPEPPTSNADVGITKDGPATVRPGGEVRYTLTVTNHGPDTADNVEVHETLPDSITPGAAPGGCTLQGRELNCTIDSLSLGGSRTYIVTGTVAPATVPGTAIGNCVTVNAITPDGNPDNNGACTQAIVQAPAADVGITKDGPATVRPGGEVRYTLTVTNHGPDTAENVVVRDELPAELTGFTVPNGCTLEGRDLTCEIGTLAKNAGRTFTVTGTVAAGTTHGTAIGNCATVNATTPDDNPDNNGSCTQTTVGPEPPASSADIAVVKTGPATAVAGRTISYLLTVTNHGPDTAENVVVRDEFPAALTVTRVPAGCTMSGRFLTCAIGNLAKGAGRTLTVTARIRGSAAGGSAIENCTTAVADTRDGNMANNRSCTAAIVRSRPVTDLAIVKTGPATAMAAEFIHYRLTVTNLSRVTAHGTFVSDALPDEVRVAEVPTGCSLSGRTVACAVGRMPGGTTRTFTITAVVRPVPAGSAIGNCGSVYTKTTETNVANNASCLQTLISKQVEVPVTG